MYFDYRLVLQYSKAKVQHTALKKQIFSYLVRGEGEN